MNWMSYVIESSPYRYIQGEMNIGYNLVLAQESIHSHLKIYLQFKNFRTIFSRKGCPTPDNVDIFCINLYYSLAVF